MVGHCGPLEVHVNQNPFPQPYQSLCVQISVDFRILRETAVYNMLIIELRAISEETICDEHRNIIGPAVPRRSAQKNPLIFLCDFQERLNPFTAANYSLFIKYNKCILHTYVLFDVIPGIHRYTVLVNIKLWIGTHVEMSQLFVPLTRIPFPGSRDDIKIRGFCHPCIFFCVYLSAIESVVERQTRSRFSASYASA